MSEIIRLKEYKTTDSAGNIYIGEFYNRLKEEALYWPVVKLFGYGNNFSDFALKVTMTTRQPTNEENQKLFASKYIIPTWKCLIPKLWSKGLPVGIISDMEKSADNNILKLIKNIAAVGPFTESEVNYTPTEDHMQWLKENSAVNMFDEIVGSGYEPIIKTFNLQQIQTVRYIKVYGQQPVTETTNQIEIRYNIPAKQRYVGIFQKSNANSTNLNECVFQSSAGNQISTNIQVAAGTGKFTFIVWDNNHLTVNRIIDLSNNFDITNQFEKTTFTFGSEQFPCWKSKNVDIFSDMIRLRIDFTTK